MHVGGKGFIITIVLLLIDVTIIPEMSGYENSFKTWYVDDDNTEGPWMGTKEYPYQNIQDAITNSSDGDVIYVYSGIYYENDFIYNTKSICLMGEDKDQTIITTNTGEEGVFIIAADSVNLSGFTFTNYFLCAGLGFLVPSGFDRIKITDNIFSDTVLCLLNNSHYNLFAHNLFLNCSLLISAVGNNDENYVKENTFLDSEYGVTIVSSHRLSSFLSNSVTIINNNFINYSISGLFNIEIHLFSRLKNNQIKNWLHYLPTSTEIIDLSNLFGQKKVCNVKMLKSTIFHGITWDKNYWDGWKGIGPLPISGFLSLIIGKNRVFTIPWIQFDWHPAKEPYDIR